MGYDTKSTIDRNNPIQMKEPTFDYSFHYLGILGHLSCIWYSVTFSTTSYTQPLPVFRAAQQYKNLVPIA